MQAKRLYISVRQFDGLRIGGEDEKMAWVAWGQGGKIRKNGNYSILSYQRYCEYC